MWCDVALGLAGKLVWRVFLKLSLDMCGESGESWSSGFESAISRL